MNFVIVDSVFSFHQILNFPFALGSYQPACATNEEAIEMMMGHRIIRAQKEHRGILRELLQTLKADEMVERLDQVAYTNEILLYEPSPVRGNQEDLIVPELAVAIPNRTGDGIEVTYSFWEHPIIRNVPGWTLLGRYYGYPECCINTFIERAVEGPIHPRFEEIGIQSQGYPCIVCDEHAKMSKEEVTALVNEKRFAPYPTDQDAETKTVDRAFERIHYLLCLQQGKLTVKYNIGD